MSCNDLFSFADLILLEFYEDNNSSSENLFFLSFWQYFDMDL